MPKDYTDYDTQGSFGDPILTHGIPIDVWNSWNSHNQDLYLQDLNRTDAQKDYSTNLDIPTSLAYAYTGTVDSLTGLDAAEAVDEGGWIDDASDTLDEVIDTGKDITTAAIIVGAILLLRK